MAAMYGARAFMVSVSPVKGALRSFAIARASAGVIVAVGRPGVGSPILGGNAEDDEDPDRQDDCDEWSHPAPPFSSVTPSWFFSGYAAYSTLLRVTCQAV